ncbi:hypothetical protein PMAYCL1PPCAC_03155 [Pristionchus mayeri]|uniref:C2H2-type domain-containing protein n=1 Tax=Pristionchus mayeri TaxID=1317129 RepID=A0AAN5C6X9_9BILA|nr:hypothetical protein PMAYCL1PPCAC_03155 [Pristionchus mayeri]
MGLNYFSIKISYIFSPKWFRQRPPRDFIYNMSESFETSLDWFIDRENHMRTVSDAKLKPLFHETSDYELPNEAFEMEDEHCHGQHENDTRPRRACVVKFSYEETRNIDEDEESEESDEDSEEESENDWSDDEHSDDQEEWKEEYTAGGDEDESIFRVRKKKNGGPKEFECDICKMKFEWKFILTRHLKSHSGVQPNLPFKCDKCNCRYSNAQHLPTTSFSIFVHIYSINILQDKNIS